MSRAYPTIASVFADKCRELVFDRKGAALAITLAFVAPIYLLVIGIYGIGEVVRNKIELQNAADSAAYSAAVVQADYLSRMATVNKAMAWTYVDLQKRSLDLAMDLFCAYVFKNFFSDTKMCKDKNSPCHMHVPGGNFNCGKDLLVSDFFLRFLGTGVGIPGMAVKFNGQNSFLSRMLPLQAFYVTMANIKGKGTLANAPKVAKYSVAIVKMMKKLKDLRDEYPEKIKKTAQQIAIANMMECKDDYIVNVTMGDPNLSFFFMDGSEDNEKAFISFADPTLKDYSPKKVFGPGTDDWIIRKGKLGFWRVYKQTKTHLYAKWDWFWTRWVHVNLGVVQLHLPPFVPGGSWGRGHPEYFGYNMKLIRKDKPVGLLVPPAIPITLLPTFFGKSGSITVAIARKTSNPLSVFSGWGGRSMTAPSILSAFNPSVAGGHRPEYMCAISSARAGYKQYNKDKKKKMDSADYTLGYVKADKEKTWNLVETDWDGVMLPVRNAWDLCAGMGNGQVFVGSQGNILKEVMLDKKNWVDAKGKKVEEKKLPDWEKLKPPGGLIKDKDDKDGKLQWDKLRDYLGH